MRLFTLRLSGNFMDAADAINKNYPSIVPGIVAMDYVSGIYSTIIVYRAERAAEAPVHVES